MNREEQFTTLCEQVTRRIAPLWPLDSYIAVNPYWGFADRPFAELAAELQGSVGERVIMDRRWYAEQVSAGKLSIEDILRAAEDLGLGGDEEDWQAYLQGQIEPPMRLPLLPELMNRQGHASISQYVLEQISHFLAAYYDRGQALWSLPKDPSQGLFAAWRQYTLHDHSLGPMGLRPARKQLLALSTDATAARRWALEVLDLPDAVVEAYLLVLLKSINGWASWCRYLLWQAELEGKSDADLLDLLSIRLVWEALLRQLAKPAIVDSWRRQLRGWLYDDKNAEHEDARRSEVLLRASEIAYRRQLAACLRRQPSRTHRSNGKPRIQAAFCIDVRSEVFRRHLESVLDDFETIGFAGFFGVLLDYKRQGDNVARAQAPVLLRPQVHVEETGPEKILQRRFRRLRRSAEWKHFKLSAASCFSFVETAGLSYVGKLLAHTVGWQRPSLPPDLAGLSAAARTRLHCVLPPSLHPEERVQMAASILTGLGLNHGMAQLVLLVGHGSSTTNNPHRAGLDCGACAGQTGEVNARAAADLLNDPAVRIGLRAKGWEIDDKVVFLPALHDTTTDQVEILVGIDDPRLDPERLRELQESLAEAGKRCGLERILRLEPDLRDPVAVAQNLLHRGRDWSQVRPEWALAGNAAFIAAPRWRTRGRNLAGRAFLHDYDANKDPDFSVLRLILTAPLVVANWINMQYYASTIDNQRQGCGNKVLHNVVGGTIGVLEGNGGDLRVGLSEQSLRDNTSNLQHEPLRLSALVEAPCEAMDRIIAESPALRQLVDNRWLTLLQIGREGELRERRGAGDWVRV
ncbi:DUF2309 domain-containing protein [Acidithiobacillus sp. AMEEHan]|uniref:YbcC family protein n=1 Tax=Acidithiobacillus sp. AMEEHan TaxID=2994951 RepID=UPI0027E4FC7D|nr:DUF2309 domain-containing protein [Acidithiobacillus sp. AMEEHan]